MVYPEDTEFEVEAILDKRWDAKLKRSAYLVKYKARHSGSSSSRQGFWNRLDKRGVGTPESCQGLRSWACHAA